MRAIRHRGERVTQSAQTGVRLNAGFTLFLAGCQRHPDLPAVSKDEIQGVTFNNMPAGTSRPATRKEIERFVQAYSKAGRCSDDVGTTPPAKIVVVLKSEAVVEVWGGAEEFQTVSVNDGRGYIQHNVKGSELGRLLDEIATDRMSPPLTAPTTVSTIAPALYVSMLLYYDPESLRVPNLAQRSEVVLRGRVVQRLSATWNSPDGTRWKAS